MMQCQDHNSFVGRKKIFSKSRSLTEDEQHSRRPSATGTGDNTTELRELVGTDRRLTLKTLN